MTKLSELNSSKLDDQGPFPGMGQFFSSPPRPDRFWGPIIRLSNG